MSEEYGQTKITNTPKTANGNGGVYTQNSSGGELETFEENEIIPTSSYTNSQGNRVYNYDLEDASLLLQDSQISITGLENSLYNFSQEFDENGRFLNSKLYLYDGYDVLSLSEKQAKINSTLFLPTYFIQNVELGNDSYTIYVDPSKPATQENLTFEVPAGPDRQAKTVNIDVNDIYSINAGQEEVIVTYRNGCQETYDYHGNCTMLNTSVPEGFEVEGAYTSFYDSKCNRYDIYQKDGIEHFAQGQDFTISASDNCQILNRGYRYTDVRGNIIESGIELTSGIPKLDFQGSSLQIGDDMKISSTNNLDISLEENGYHVFMKEKEDGSIATPDGFYLDCKNVEDIAVTEEGTTIHLFGEGYLQYDKNGKLINQQLPVYSSSDLSGFPSIFQNAYNFLRNSFLSWSDLLTPLESSRDFLDNGYRKEYYPLDISESIWQQAGISITGLEPYYNRGYQIFDLENRLDTTGIFLSEFNQYMVIRGNDFSIDGLLKVPERDVENVEFGEGSYKIHLKSDTSKYDYLTFKSIESPFSPADISDITVYLDSCVVSFQDGRTLTFDLDGKMIAYTGDWETESIYSDINLYREQYGGNQMDFKYRADELLEDEWIQNFLNQNFPDADSMDQYLYLIQVYSVGCSYVSISNTIFNQFEGKEEEFKKIFGYDMYKVDENGLRNYNYEYLTLEFFTYVWKDLHGLDITQMSTDIGNLVHTSDVEEMRDSLYDDDVNPYFHTFSGFASAEERVQDAMDFFQQKTSDYQLDGEVVVQRGHGSITDEEIEMIREALEEGKSVSIGAGNYDLYEINPTTGERGEISTENGGGHAMSITGLTKKGDIIVSSWGNKYIVDLSDFSFLHVDMYDLES